MTQHTDGVAAGKGDGATALDCYSAVRMLWEYLDDELGEVDRARLDAHLAACDDCPPHFEFERHFIETVSKAVLHSAPADEAADERLRARVVRALQLEGFVRT